MERNRYNTVARDYNVYIKKFPASVVAGFLNFDEMPLFQAAEGSEKAPEVNFN